jgi:peptide-methionine (R)-S-oxide reductase
MIIGLLLGFCWAAAAGPNCRAGDEPASEAESKSAIVPIHKSDAEWKKQLTSKQFQVTRRKATEAPFTGKLTHNKRPGSYHCICCDLAVFGSDAKFDSQTGWPSYWAPLEEDHVTLAPDVSELPARTEVLCARCEAHLGHVFDDGPPPTGLRFCINSTALKFVEAPKQSPAAKKPAAKSKSKKPLPEASDERN